MINGYQYRDYQSACDLATKQALCRKPSALIVAPCAAGKGMLLSGVIEWLYQAKRKVAVIVDRKQLVEQTAENIRKYTGISDIGVACKSVSKYTILSAPVTVASRQTLSRSPQFKTNCLIFDEQHLFNQERGQYLNILENCRKNHPALRWVGYTATPYQFTGYTFGKDKLFDSIDYKISTKILLDKDYLSPLIWKLPESVVKEQNAQLDQLKRTASGDLNEKQQAKVVNCFVDAVVQVWFEHCRNRKTAIFALNIEHAELIREAFKAAGKDIFIIHSKMGDDQLENNLEAFRSSDKGIIVNVGKLTIGSDIPDISAIILARRTLSTSLFFQMVGRGMRTAKKKGKVDCLILDLCGNAMIHNTDPDAPIIQFKGKKHDKAPLKLCPICETMLPIYIRRCKCGFEFPPPPQQEKKEIAADAKPGKLINFRGFETRDVDRINFEKVVRNGKAPFIKVNYLHGARRVVSEWLFPAHLAETWPKKKTDKRWIELGGDYPTPRTADIWMQRLPCLKVPSKVIVDFNKKPLPEVKGVSL